MLTSPARGAIRAAPCYYLWSRFAQFFLKPGARRKLYGFNESERIHQRGTAGRISDGSAAAMSRRSAHPAASVVGPAVAGFVALVVSCSVGVVLTENTHIGFWTTHRIFDPKIPRCHISQKKIYPTPKCQNVSRRSAPVLEGF